MIEQILVAAVLLLWPVLLYVILKFAMGGKR